MGRHIRYDHSLGCVSPSITLLLLALALRYIYGTAAKHYVSRHVSFCGLRVFSGATWSIGFGRPMYELVLAEYTHVLPTGMIPIVVGGCRQIGNGGASALQRGPVDCLR